MQPHTIYSQNLPPRCSCAFLEDDDDSVHTSLESSRRLGTPHITNKEHKPVRRRSEGSKKIENFLKNHTIFKLEL